MQRYTIATRHWGDCQVLRPVPAEVRQGDVLMVDPWGDLAPLRQHPTFASLIPVVSGEDFSLALHGYAKPLMNVIGLEPRYQLLRIPPAYRVCGLRDECVMYRPDRCEPNKRLPECWWPEAEESARRAMAVVVLAWAEDRYVVVVDGDEFSLG